MRFEWSALVALIGIGCNVDTHVEAELLATRSGEELRLLGDREDLHLEGSEISLEWIAVETPPGGTHALRVEGVETVAVFSRQGRYVLDRWLTFQLSSTWTHRYAIDVGNAPPHASIEALVVGPVGSVVVLDASNSTDFEESELRYRWSLTFRPADSAVMLSDLESVTTQFIPDEPGNYIVELDVFDGQDWADASDEVVIEVP